MKIENIDNILNKEKSPDKAERSASIDEIKKTQKFFSDFNELTDATAISNSQEIFDYLSPGSSKLKKLLLNSSGPEVANFNNISCNSGNDIVHNNSSEYINNNNHDTSGSGGGGGGSSSNVNNLPVISNKVVNNSNINNNSNSGNSSNFAKSNIESNVTAPIAPTTYSNKKEIAEKKSAKSSDRQVFSCTECNELYQKSNLFDHMKNVHKKFTCLYCYGFFVNIESLERHLVRKHKVQKTAFFDEQTLKSYFNVKQQQQQQDECDNVSKVIKAVCCKCGVIHTINDLPTNCCGGREKASTTVTSVKGKTSPAIHPSPPTNASTVELHHPNHHHHPHNHQRHQNNNQNIDSGSAVQNDLGNSNDHTSLLVKRVDKTKEDRSFEKETHSWLHSNSKVPTFNGATSSLNETSSHIVPQTANNSDNTMLSSSSSWHIEEQKVTNINNNPEEKLVVPKLTLKIPKAFQNQQFDTIDSDEDSGDEQDDEDSEADSDSDGQDLSNSNNYNNVYSSTSLSDTEKEESTEKVNASNNDTNTDVQKRPENMPILKLKIKNLTSNPESVLESFDNFSPSATATTIEDTTTMRTQTDVDMTECPMELEPDLETTRNDTTVQEPPEQQQQQQEEEEEEPEKEPEPKKIIIDGVQIMPANEDTLPIEIRFDEGLDKIQILKLMKICLRASFPLCLYCNHARKIVVNGKGLALHFITHHRFHAFVDSITGEELHPEKFVAHFEQSIEELQECYFNLDSYDDHDEEKKEGHVTISHDKLYECFQCRFQTPIHKELYLHNRKMHQKLLISCLMCKTSFHSYSELLCHICPGVANKLTFTEYKFYCCLCNLSNIPSAFRLMVHLRKKHFACDVCLEKCSDQSKLSSHVWKHKLLHICYRCHIFYQNKADIMKHLFWKHGTEGVECKKCLQKKWPHVYHFCVPPANFTCQYCEMQFSRAMALKVHLRLHEDGAKYACTEIGCEKKFISKKLLIRHLERHQSELAAQQNGDQERAEGTVIIPAEIPNGCCTRTIPVVFKRFVKKPAIRKIEAEPKVEQTKEEPESEPKKSEEKKDSKSLLDLPETKLNLSESSESDSSSSSSDEETEDKKSSAVKQPEQQQKQEESSEHGKASPLSEKLASEQTEEKDDTVKPLAKVSTLSDSEEEEEEQEESGAPKDSKPDVKDAAIADSMKNILENLKNYQESQQQPPQEDSKEAIKEDIDAKVQEAEPQKMSEEKTEEKEVEDKLPEKVVLHVCQSDHDYAKLYRPPVGTTDNDLEDMIQSATIDREKNKNADAKNDKSKAKASAQNKKKSAEKSNKNDDFSSSDSSSGSSSDSSSGSSSGSSSSSSSGSSSDSSSSEASSTKSASKPRNKKYTKKRSKKEKKAEVETEEEEPSRDPDDIIYESDLQTDETDTDEDFYDEHPLTLNNQALSEKRKQLGNIDGIVENSRPSTPSLPPDEKIEVRIKLKKRKKDHKKTSSPAKRMCRDNSLVVNADDDSINFSSNRNHSHPAQPETPNFKNSFIHTSTPIAPPRIELHQANLIRQLLQSTQQQPILPILLEQQQQQHYHQQQPMQQQSYLSNIDYINVSHVSSAQSSRMNSDNEQSGIKRSQRRRIPNKFYGYTSDDETRASQIQNANDPFKPIPPPVLTWDKEDLPSRTKSPNPLSGSQLPQPQQQQQQQRVAPIKLSLNKDDLQQQLHTFASEHKQVQPLAPPEIYDNYDSQHTKQLPVNNLSTNENSFNVSKHHSSECDSSDDGNDQLQISEPRKRKRKLPSQNMYAFHTLETPATVPINQPPIPRLKLTIGSNNKIRRRNINPLKPPAKKRKINPKTNDKSILNNSSFGGGSGSNSFKPISKNSEAQGPSRSSLSQAESKPQKQVGTRDKQEKLQEAIMKTQQYFQRYNQPQVASEIPQDSADGDGRVYCYCRRPYDDLQGMIGCDGPSCQIEWFHFECVGIFIPPKGNWFCPECSKDQPPAF